MGRVPLFFPALRIFKPFSNEHPEAESFMLPLILNTVPLPQCTLDFEGITSLHTNYDMRIITHILRRWTIENRVKGVVLYGYATLVLYPDFVAKFLSERHSVKVFDMIVELSINGHQRRQ